MTIAEKRNKISKALESFSNEQLEEMLVLIEQIKKNDKKRIEYVKDLLKKEQNLFDRLAK